jgi:hypothetical protein
MKTIIQSDIDVKHKQYVLFKKIQHEAGILSLFKGLSTTLLRAFFTNAVIFYLNEICHIYLDPLI